MKQSLGTNTYLFPLPTAVVGMYDAADRPNMMTASWVGIVNSRPSMLSVSLRKATYTYYSILHHKAFTVSLPSYKHLAEMDYVGTKTGKNEDKFQTTGLTPIASIVIHAPYVSEFPLVLECRLLKHEDLGLHTIFIAEILDVKIDEDCLLASGKPDFSALNLISYAHGEREYYAQGDFLGKANASWQNSTLNPKFAQGHEGKAFAFLQEHYRKLDAQAARLRFRPIIMTSLAFMIGCIPLAISSGAGDNSRQALGTAVIGGMLAATCIATVFVPFFLH